MIIAVVYFLECHCHRMLDRNTLVRFMIVLLCLITVLFISNQLLARLHIMAHNMLIHIS